MKDFRYEFISIKKFQPKWMLRSRDFEFSKKNVRLYQTGHNKEVALNYLEGKASVLIENIAASRESLDPLMNKVSD
jgi:hypothetical protein